jgi:hypothetical protein
MRLDEDRQAMPVGCSEDRLDEAEDLIVIFQAPAGMDRNAEIAAFRMFRGDGVSLGRRIDPSPQCGSGAPASGASLAVS